MNETDFTTTPAAARESASGQSAMQRAQENAASSSSLLQAMPSGPAESCVSEATLSESPEPEPTTAAAAAVLPESPASSEATGLSASSTPPALPSISLIAPCYNEERNVGPLVEAIANTFGAKRIPCEVVLVNDGSSDGTAAALAEVAARDSFDLPEPHAPFTIVTINLSRNFGKEGALVAGMEASRGDTLCFIDADLQQDPQVALDMYQYLVSHDDIDVVAAYQAERTEGKATSWMKRKFYSFFNATSDGIELPADMSDFRVFTRQVADALLSLPERERFTKGLFAWVGFNTHAVPYTAKERNEGTSSWSTRALFKYAYSGITSFSTWPLKILKVVGSIVALLALLYLLYVIIFDYLIFGIGIPGYPTLVCLILLFGGLQLLALGIVGDYLAKSYVEAKKRPLYIARDVTRRTL